MNAFEDSTMIHKETNP